jgi:phosphoribosylformylglycinamidine synthase
VSSAEHFFKAPCWYGDHLDTNAWRSISYASTKGDWKMHRDWKNQLCGQYVYYVPDYVTVRGTTNTQVNTLEDAGFASARQIGEASTAPESYTEQKDAKPVCLSAKQERILKRLLCADEHSQILKDQDMATCVVVTPRAGMLSPWASKTQDILRNCGLDVLPRLERGRLINNSEYNSLGASVRMNLYGKFYDPMLEELWGYEQNNLAGQGTQFYGGLNYIRLQHNGYDALSRANELLGLSMNKEEMQYLHELYKKWKRDPTDAEIMMFGQLNSEHCRHKVFNASIKNPGKLPASLFAMIKNTAKCTPEGVEIAYEDNAAVTHGYPSEMAYIDTKDKRYREFESESTYWTLKVETHNHPTAIAPFAGAGTGIGGEIRDEAAVGRGARSLMGMSGYSVSYLCIPGAIQPWESQFANLSRPKTMRSALDIMLIAPVGASAFANEFGRPNLCGYFRSFEMRHGEKHYGYHKPIMIAGGVGRVLKENIRINPDTIKSKAALKVIVLGGPALLIGIGGGTASSSLGDAGDASQQNSVQRQDPQMQRRCQEVIDRCASMKNANPILRIHDVGGGGLSNAIPELLCDLNSGGHIELDSIPSADPSLSPMELWCNESQERFVLAMRPTDVAGFDAICERERCPYAVIGETNDSGILHVSSKANNNDDIINMPLKDLFSDVPRPSLRFGKLPPMHLKDQLRSADFSKINFSEALLRILSHPTVASKDFLINIADRSIGGLVCRDQMVGRWQVPVADSAVSCADYHGFSGIAMAVGERTPLAVHDPLAMIRMAVGEALTNIASNVIRKMSDIKLSANWMAAVDDTDEKNKLMHAVRDLGMDLCPKLGMAVVVGKDSLSMRTRWTHRTPAYRRRIEHDVIAPLSGVITASAPVLDVRQCRTPQIKHGKRTRLLLIDLGRAKNRMAGSCLSECYADVMDFDGHACPNLDEPEDMRGFMSTMRQCYEEGLVIAYHDRSDGGLIACLLEMCFAGRFGVHVHAETLAESYEDMMRILFNEELGAVVQIEEEHIRQFMAHWEKIGLGGCVLDVGSYTEELEVQVFGPQDFHYEESLVNLYRAWREPSIRLRKLRDTPECIDEEQSDDESFDTYTGAFFMLGFEHDESRLLAPYLKLKRPRLMLLREQGTNGHHEMAAAFSRAKFDVVDVRTSDIYEGSVKLNEFQGMAVAGGFSYGDVLGAGRGWAHSILWNDRARAEFEAFFARPDIFVLGVCNGCQMLSALRELIPGTDNWPHFQPNLSGQFEARLSMVHVPRSTSILTQEMDDAFVPVPIAHGEGRAVIEPVQLRKLISSNCVSMRYSHNTKIAHKYPQNPNGSAYAIAGVSNEDGRITIMMPHPERAFRAVQYSWKPGGLGDSAPWMRMFCNARRWVAQN